MAIKSTDQAKNRVIGPASRKENSTPSGVLMDSVLVCPTLIGLNTFTVMGPPNMKFDLSVAIAC
jgi:hypothetical protein